MSQKEDSENGCSESHGCSLLEEKMRSEILDLGNEQNLLHAYGFSL